MYIHLKPFALTALCLMAGPCFADVPPSASSKTNLSVAPIMHTAECPNPKREICVIKKPVGSGYRILTPGMTLEDAGDYWLADFTKPVKGKSMDTAKISFRVIGKDNDIHEIEVFFANGSTPKAKPALKNVRCQEFIDGGRRARSLYTATV